MYESFYGLTEKPFSLLPDPTFLYPSKKHRNALAMLEYGLTNQAGFTVISGDIGAGKTTLIRYILNNMDQDVTIGLISNTYQEAPGELLKWILMAFNLGYAGKEKVELHQTFVDFLIREYAKNRRTVLIVDEAQNLSSDTLEELRMLSNINADKDQILQLILVGQPELRNTLRRPELLQFAQRIASDYHLESMDLDDTREYIHHRLGVAGGAPSLFTEEACQLIYQTSGGVPRLINLLCDMALVYGYGAQQKSIDADLVEEVVRDRANRGVLTSQGASSPKARIAPASQPKKTQSGKKRTVKAHSELDADTLEMLRSSFSGKKRE